MAKCQVLAVVMTLCGWGMIGCIQRPYVEPAHCESHVDGNDIFCTRVFFYHRFPAIEQQDNARSSASDPFCIVTNPRTSESLHWKLTYGLYDPHTRVCWTVASDPQHPTHEERSWMQHEHCHRVEDIYGWQAAAPMWNALPRCLHTHPDIEARLRMWRRTHGG
jgi:hypothetical protein